MRIRNGSGKENAFDIGREMKKVMFDDVGIFRTEEGHEARAGRRSRELQERFKHVRVEDTGRIFNTELLNAWELGNLLDLAEVIDRLRAEPHREPRRPCPRGFPQARRRQLAQAHAHLA